MPVGVCKPTNGDELRMWDAIMKKNRTVKIRSGIDAMFRLGTVCFLRLIISIGSRVIGNYQTSGSQQCVADIAAG